MSGYMSAIKKFVKDGGGSLLQKALTTGVSSGNALIHEYLEETITNQLVTQFPEYAFIKPKKISSNSYKHKARNTRSALGGAMGESATTGQTNSGYAQPDIPLKIIRRKPRVTDFLQDATSDNIDAFAQELEYEVENQGISVNLYNLFGNANADSYQYSGWDRSIVTNRNSVRFDGWASGVPQIPSLNTFDNILDASNRKNGSRHTRMFVMTTEMGSLLSRLYSTIRKNIPMETVRVAGGHELESYRGVPILTSTMIPGSGSATMGTVTAASAGTTGGSLSDGTYYFRVQAVYADGGETMASAESSVTLAGATATQRISLTFAAITNAIGYKVFYSSTTGLTGMGLITWRAAKTYDGDGTITGDVTSIELLSVAADTTVSGITGDRPLTATGGVNGENIYLIDCDEFQGMGRFAHNNPGNREDGIVTVEPLAKTDSFLEMLIRTQGAIIPSFEATSVKGSGWRVD